jgi:hypothetical protein
MAGFVFFTFRNFSSCGEDTMLEKSLRIVCNASRWRGMGISASVKPATASSMDIVA